MIRKIINGFLSAALCLSAVVACTKEEAMTPHRLSGPKVMVSDVGTTSFKVSWDVVTDAGSYTYRFNGGEEVTTRERSLTFSDLEPDMEYTFAVRTDAGINGNYVSSDYVTVHVITDGKGVLDKPEPELVAAYKSKTIITWKAVRGAVTYEYEVGKYSGTLTACSVDLSGFEGSTDYVFRVRALPEDKYTEASPYAELHFTTRPDEEDIPQIIMDYRESGHDYINFNIYAVPDFRYLYFAVPASYFENHTDEEIQNIYLGYVLEAIEESGSSIESGIARYASFGSATYTEYPLYPETSYNVVAFGIDAKGRITTPLYKTPAKTLANGASGAPEVEGPEWFRQSLYHGVFGGYNPSNCLFASWKGTGVSSVKYILTSTSSFNSVFDGNADKFEEYVKMNGSMMEDENIEDVNGEKGLTSRISLASARSYTLGSLATGKDGSTAFAVSTMATKASPYNYDWVLLELGTSGEYPASTALAGRVSIGFDATETLNLQLSGGRYYFCEGSEVDGRPVSELPDIVASKGIDFTEHQIGMINMTGSVDMSFTSLKPDTDYALLVTLTSLSGDESTRYVFASTEAELTAKSASGEPEVRFETVSPRILDIYEISR